MKRLWICVAFLAIFGNLAIAEDSDEQNSWYDDDWYEDISESTEYAGGEGNSHRDAKDLPSDVKFRSTESDKLYDQDYQFEDNRSEVKEDNIDNVADNTHSDTEKNTGKPKDIEYLTSTEVDNLGIVLSTLNIDKEKIISHSATTSDSDAQILGTSAEIGQDDFNFEKNIFEDTKSILNEETKNDFSRDGIIELNPEKTTAFTEIFEETSKLLDEALDTMEVDSNNGGEEKDKQLNLKEKQATTEEDTPNQDISDFRDDLNNLRETRTKLNDFDDNILESNDKDKISSNSVTSSTESDKITDDDKIKGSEKQLETIGEVFPDDSQLFNESTTSQPILYLHDALPATDSQITNLVADKAEMISSSLEPTLTAQKLILRNDLDQIRPVNSELISEIESSSSSYYRDFELTSAPRIEDLSISETNDLMNNFASRNRIAEVTKLDVEYSNNVWLTVDNPTVITSNGYPNPYPTNSTTDWMITGDGMGIELNITDLAINGHAGHYLLFKPGGVDESGSTGLIFSYNLHNERKYRFLDVDKMFVRFEAKGGPQVLRGFSFSVRMVAPRPGAPEPMPEPEPVIPEPPETITLNLGGVSLEAFLQIEEQFRQIIAEMATTYITNNGIDPGVNTTLELTQIRSRALCFHNWPKFEQCVEVSFGVPLVYEDDDDEAREPRLNSADLTNMWETYSQLDPYAGRLRSLGITEYQEPNDRGILTVWLVIAGGVVISMAMLAFALWRFSCFEDYTRMPAFNDTDSLKEKRNLDLYPTPHQTLPPLYTDTDYKWADAKYDNITKVDVRGYSNKSYLRDEDLYDFDSDEDIVSVSARNTSFSPRDIYSV